VEAGETPSGGLGAELDRIGSAVDGGDTDLRGLGFWRLVALIKRDDELIERYAEQVGRIDAKAFRAGVRVRIPVWAGNLLLAMGLGVGFGGFVLAAARGTHNFTFEYDATLAGIGLLVAAGAWDVAVHSPTHWLVGRAVGMRFLSYFLRTVTAPPGLKIDYASYLRTSPIARAWMHASGAIATKLVPFLVLALASATGIDAPGWATGILWVLGVGQILSDVVFSTRKSDWKKVRRELAVARARRRVHTGRA
jgi:hypothetical protein